MPGRDVRSALVVSCGASRPASRGGTAAEELFEIVALLRDPAVGGFEVSVRLEPTGPELRQELVRFLADRAPHDTVVVHLTGRLPADPGSLDDAHPLPVLEQELPRCRSEHVVVLLDGLADDSVSTAAPEPEEPEEPWRALDERLGGPGRIVQHAPTGAIIDALRQPGDGRGAAVQPELAAVLRIPTVGSPLSPPVGGRTRRPGAAFVVAVPATSFGLLGVGGAVGGTLSAAAAAYLTWSALPAVTRVWRSLPPDDVALGEGVPFYRLYMLRRSQRSKDYFRHH